MKRWGSIEVFRNTVESSTAGRHCVNLRVVDTCPKAELLPNLETRLVKLEEKVSAADNEMVAETPLFWNEVGKAQGRTAYQNKRRDGICIAGGQKRGERNGPSSPSHSEAIKAGRACSAIYRRAGELTAGGRIAQVVSSSTGLALLPLRVFLAGFDCRVARLCIAPASRLT